MILVKFFDRIWHASLINKLREAGISRKLLDWFTNYPNVDRELCYLGLNLYGPS